jgi:hypothetical protein
LAIGLIRVEPLFVVDVVSNAEGASGQYGIEAAPVVSHQEVGLSLVQELAPGAHIAERATAFGAWQAGVAAPLGCGVACRELIITGDDLVLELLA